MSDPLNAPRPFQPQVVDLGLFVEHDMPCPVCVTEHAQLYTNTGVFHPCVHCDEQGWRLTKLTKRPWWAFWR